MELLDIPGYLNGTLPETALTSDGTYLYGTAQNGNSAQGIIFKILPDGTGFAKIHDFNEATIGGFLYSGYIYPNSLFYEGGYLYGMTSRAGNSGGGIVFKIKTDGTGYMKLLDCNLSNGFDPRSSFISDGTFLYGLMSFGGLNGKGVFFKIKPDGTGYTILLDFDNTLDSRIPGGSLISDGTYFYGMTSYGGVNDSGTVFKVLPDGTSFSKLHDFNLVDGILPLGSLVYDGTYLYGITEKGAMNGRGSIFKVKTDGSSFTKLLDFSASSGNAHICSLVLEGNYLYGTTEVGGVNLCGTVFKIKTDGSGFSELLSFNQYTEGCSPWASLISDGTYLYGTTRSGGSLPINQAVGTIFKLGLLTDVEEKIKSNNFFITPNPTSATLSITSSVDYDGIKIINSIGQTVLIQENKHEPISVSDLSNGIYFIQLLDKKGNLLKTEKFIKE